MKKSMSSIFFLLFFLGFQVLSFAQFKPEEIAEREKWEKFLKEAKIVETSQPLSEREAVTEPWRLKLEKDGVVKYGWWKNVEGRVKGFLDSWKWEIAAYRLDKLLELNMVPPYEEIRFRGDRGVCSLEAEYWIKYREKQEQNIPCPNRYVPSYNRANYLMKAWDNLIANEDRNWGDILITEDWRLILIDHSRSFRTSKKFTKTLVHMAEGNKEPIKELPRAFVEKLKSLDFVMIRNAVGEYLTDKEIDAVIVRRDLILQDVDRLIKKFGEDKFFY
ncbi:MAG: hypothetical protein OEY25_07285 [Candidatus Aminicenantes bacterium]|nr:hypothetical protein [Candidatus Aminicenantes bacterium]MDH5704616.1 hypothetical protein [Candidatus Aminicenantes bacterium]